MLDDILFAFVVVRIIPIVLNVIFIFIVFYYSYFNYNSNSVLSVHEKAISVLVGRLKWYPIITIANRFFPFWYDLEFPNYEDDGYSMTNTYKYTINILGIISPIIAPIGFLIIYLIMYPRALKFVQYKVVSSIQSLNDGFLWMSSSGDNTNDVTSKKNRSTGGWHSDSSSGVDRERGGEENSTTNTRLSSSSSHQLRTTNDLHRQTQKSIRMLSANESSNFTSTHTNESSSQESVEPNINPSENEPEDGGDYDNDGRGDGGNILSSDGSDLRTISISELSNKNRVLSTNSAELLIDTIQWDQLRDEDLIKLIDKEIKDLKVKPTTISSVPLGNIPQNRNSVVGRDSIVNSNSISGGNRSFSNHNNSLTNSLSFADHNRQSTTSNNSINSRSLASSGGNSFTLNPIADENHRAVP